MWDDQTKHNDGLFGAFAHRYNKDNKAYLFLYVREARIGDN